MKPTGALNAETKKQIAELEKHYRKTKQAIWLDLAERLKKARRQRPSVNLWKIQKFATMLGNKTIVVPGKVLGFGELEHNATIVALEYSKDAKKKIAAHGTALTFAQAVEKKIKPSEMIIIK